MLVVPLPHLDQHTPMQPDPQTAAAHYTPSVPTTSHTHLATDLPTYSPLVLANSPTQLATDPPIYTPLVHDSSPTQLATALTSYSPLVPANPPIQPTTGPPIYSPLVHVSTPKPSLSMHAAPSALHLTLTCTGYANAHVLPSKSLETRSSTKRSQPISDNS